MNQPHGTPNKKLGTPANRTVRQQRIKKRRGGARNHIKELWKNDGANAGETQPNKNLRRTLGQANRTTLRNPKTPGERLWVPEILAP
jgi:hypothetical protein